MCCFVRARPLCLPASRTRPQTKHVSSRQATKRKSQGPILSRDGDLVRVLDKKSGELVVVNITDNTKIERKKHGVLFVRHTDMDVTAMVPGLRIEAEGVANSKGQLDASTISFTPDEFAIEVAQEQQVLSNK